MQILSACRPVRRPVPLPNLIMSRCECGVNWGPMRDVSESFGGSGEVSTKINK
jgi:hypothetical protein